jgi:hypothetical protein
LVSGKAQLVQVPPRFEEAKLYVYMGGYFEFEK